MNSLPAVRLAAAVVIAGPADGEADDIAYRSVANTLWLLVLVLSVGMAHAQSLDGYWSSHFYINGTNRSAETIARIDDWLVIGGYFHTAGPVIADNVAWYDATGWHAFDTPIPGIVEEFCLHDGVLHAMTAVSGVVDIWALDDLNWLHAASFDLSLPKKPCASFGGDLYVGGWRWDGDDLVQAVATDSPIRCATTTDRQLILGGTFRVANGDSLGSLVAWNGKELGCPWPVTDEDVLDVAILDAQPWIVTSRWVGSGTNTRLRCWTDGGWSTVMSVNTPYPYGWVSERHIFVLNGDLYYSFSGTNDLYSYIRRVWRWNPDSGSLDAVAEVPVRDAAPWEGGFVAVHDHPGDPTLRTHNVTFFPASGSGETPRALSSGGLGFSNPVDNIATTSGLSIGGSFEYGAGLNDCCIVHYEDGQWTGWSKANDEYVGTVSSISYYGPTLLASVTDPADSNPAGVYMWSEDDWSPFSTPALSQMTQIAGLYCYGINGADVYNPLFVEPVGTAVGGEIDALAAAWYGQLVAGGNYESIGNSTQGVLAVYAGSSWHDLAAPLSGHVRAIATFQENMVVAGDLAFPEQSGEQVAIWRDGAWDPLPGIFDDHIEHICEYQDMLAVGGQFGQVGGLSATHIAAWQDGEWHALGDGCNGPVYTLGVTEDKLWIGGSFTVAGGHVACGLTSWQHGTALNATDETPKTTVMSLYPNPCNPSVTIAFELPHSADLTIDIFDLAGRRVGRIMDGWQPAGPGKTVWNGTDAGGRPVASGTYLVQLRTPISQSAQRLVLVR